MSSHAPSSNNFAAGGGSSKRVADEAKPDPNSQQAAKRKRPQSCDTCRSRKIKCVRLQVDGLDTSADNRCVQCRAIDAKCTFDYVPKRPGPQSSFAKTARREAEAQVQPQPKSSTSAQQHPQHASSGQSRSSTAGGFNNVHGLPPGGAAQNTSGSSTSDYQWYRALAAQNFASGSGSGTQTRSPSWSGGANFDTYLNTSMLAMTPSHFANMPGGSPFDFPALHMGPMSGPSPAMSGSNASSATPASYASSSSWQAPARSDAASSRAGAPLAPLTPMQPHLPNHQQGHLSQHSDTPQANQMYPFDLPNDMGEDSSSTSLPLPIPSFSRVQSPAPVSATLPQVINQNRSQTLRPQQQPQDLPVGPSSDASKERSSPLVASSGRKGNGAPNLSAMYCGPVLRPRSLEDIAPRQTFLSVVSLYFHYLWPLLPIVDRPTFSHDLINRRDERDGAFLAFVLSLTSYTLIQCPRTVIPAPSTVYRRLHRICHLTSRRMQPHVYDPPQLLHVNTLYCDHIYLGTVGKRNAANAVLAEAVQVAYALGLHDERKDDTIRNVAPYGLDASSFAHYRAPTANAVNRELRKRMFWVLHGSSTTIAVLQDAPALIHAVDVCVDLPLAVDEEVLANPNHVQRAPSVLSGFLTVTRLHQVMLELLESYRRDRRFPIDDLSVARSRIRYLADVVRRLGQAIDAMPDELREPIYRHAPPESIRRRGETLPALESVAAAGRQPQDAPLLQAIGFDAATQTALGNHLSGLGGTSPWPWPAETFTREGLPNADVRSSNNSSANHSPHPTTDASLPPADGGVASGGAGIEGGQTAHQVLAPPAAGTTGSGFTVVDFVNVFRPSPPPSSAPVLSPMCTMHANIVATESLIRFLVAEYHELVVTRIHELKLRLPLPHSTRDHPEDVEGQGWQDAAQNMLRVFDSLPLEALASNGYSLISKILYVVTALLGRSGGRTEGVGFGYMSGLLATLTRLSQTRADDGVEGLGEEEGEGEGERDARRGAGGDEEQGGNGGGNRDGSGSGSSGANGTNGRSGNTNNPSSKPTSTRSRADSGSNLGAPISGTSGGNTSGGRQVLPLPPQAQAQAQAQAYDSPIPYTPCSSSGVADTSASSSAANTASTTPTSEHPPSSALYDKLLLRAPPASETFTSHHPHRLDPTATPMSRSAPAPASTTTVAAHA